MSKKPQSEPILSSTPRQHVFQPSSFTVVRLEELDEIANIRADLIATYQPVNSEELSAIENLALARQAKLRCARLEAGMYTTCLNEALDPDGRPLRLLTGELIQDIPVLRQQNRNFILYDGFSRLNGKSKDILIFLRIQAQAERLCRRAVEELERARKLRSELARQPIPDPPPQPAKPTPAESASSNPAMAVVGDLPPSEPIFSRWTSPPPPSPAPPVQTPAHANSHPDHASPKPDSPGPDSDEPG